MGRGTGKATRTRCRGIRRESAAPGIALSGVDGAGVQQDLAAELGSVTAQWDELAWPASPPAPARVRAARVSYEQAHARAVEADADASRAAGTEHAAEAERCAAQAHAVLSEARAELRAAVQDPAGETLRWPERYPDYLPRTEQGRLIALALEREGLLDPDAQEHRDGEQAVSGLWVAPEPEPELEVEDPALRAAMAEGIRVAFAAKGLDAPSDRRIEWYIDHPGAIGDALRAAARRADDAEPEGLAAYLAAEEACLKRADLAEQLRDAQNGTLKRLRALSLILHAEGKEFSAELAALWAAAPPRWLAGVEQRAAEHRGERYEPVVPVDPAHPDFEGGMQTLYRLGTLYSAGEIARAAGESVMHGVESIWDMLSNWSGPEYDRPPAGE